MSGLEYEGLKYLAEVRSADECPLDEVVGCGGRTASFGFGRLDAAKSDTKTVGFRSYISLIRVAICQRICLLFGLDDICC